MIGKRARRVRTTGALDCVAGYTIGIDLSARDWQFHPKHLVKFDLFGGKGFDDSCPLGPKSSQHASSITETFSYGSTSTASSSRMQIRAT